MWRWCDEGWCGGVLWVEGSLPPVGHGSAPSAAAAAPRVGVEAVYITLTWISMCSPTHIVLLIAFPKRERMCSNGNTLVCISRWSVSHLQLECILLEFDETP